MVWKNPWYDPRLSHHKPDGFCNLTADTRQPGDVQRWRRERKAAALPHPPQGGYDEFITQWWQTADLQQKPGDGAWWLGHATLLIRLNGLNILTDPVFSQRASPIPFMGPARKTPLAIKLNQLPTIDAVLLSHNHYDHLDSASIRALRRHSPECVYYVPLCVGRWLRRKGITRIVERDWWQSHTDQGLTFTAVPARHWSMRTPWDRNRSLWAGWVIESQSQRVYFSGDTAWEPELLTLPERLGPLTAAAIPIGAYAPEWFMGASHIAPSDTVKLWQQIGRPLTIPIHWGVFELADESLDAPPLALKAALDAAGEPKDALQPLKIGGYVAFDY